MTGQTASNLCLPLFLSGCVYVSVCALAHTDFYMSFADQAQVFMHAQCALLSCPSSRLPLISIPESSSYISAKLSTSPEYGCYHHYLRVRSMLINMCYDVC